MMGQSFFLSIATSADNNKQMQGKNKYDSHATIKHYMLPFARCNNDHIAPPAAQICQGWVRQVRQR
jgi:hypothetical protein